MENKVEGATCACGKRPSGMYFAFSGLVDRADGVVDSCTCEGAEGGSRPEETDFTNLK